MSDNVIVIEISQLAALAILFILLEILCSLLVPIINGESMKTVTTYEV